MKQEPQLVIHVNRAETAEAVPAADIVQAVIAVTEAEGVDSGEISITFIDAEGIAELNQKHLDRDGPTDVIAFNLAETKTPMGDVYICPEIAKDSADDRGIELREELLRLVVHGMLHVVGYDHPEGEGREESEMYRRQEMILSQLV